MTGTDPLLPAASRFRDLARILAAAALVALGSVCLAAFWWLWLALCYIVEGG